MKRKLLRASSALFIALPTIVLGLSACDNKSSELEELRNKVSSLEGQLDSCTNGAQKLIHAAKRSFEQKSYNDVLATAEKLDQQHPGTPEALEAISLAEMARKFIADEKRAQEENAALATLEEKRRIENEKVEKEHKLAKALANMSKKIDEIQDVVFYMHKAAPKFVNSRSFIKPYIVAHKSGGATLRLENTYVSDEWLFIESYLIKADDSNYDLPGGYSEVERDNGYSGIWEWTDEVASGENIAMLKAIASSKKATIRYVGKQYYKDRAITDSEKRIIKEVLLAYEALSKP